MTSAAHYTYLTYLIQLFKALCRIFIFLASCMQQKWGMDLVDGMDLMDNVDRTKPKSSIVNRQFN